MKNQIKEIKLSEIILDKKAQPRADVDGKVIDEYRADLMAGDTFPPLVVFANGDDKYYLADGWHRYHAMVNLNSDGEAVCTVHHGDLRDAILYSCGVNTDHGKRRTEGDKRRAIKRLLQDDEWVKWSNREILRNCKIPYGGSWNSFIESERKNLTAPAGAVTTERQYTTKHGTVSTMNTSNIGSNSKTAESESEQPTFQVITEQPEPAFSPLNYQLFVSPINELREHLPPASVDVIITDPPYPKEYMHTYFELAEQAAEILKPSGVLVAMSGHPYIKELIEGMSKFLKFHWLGCYYMPTGPHASLQPYRVSVYWKPLLIFCKNKWPNRVFKDVFINNEADKDFHHWGQGVGGFEEIVNAFTFPNETVLDPFVGGGATAIATLKNGRYFIGSDISTDEVEKTRKRIVEVVK
jgi:DNA modification methylase